MSAHSSDSQAHLEGKVRDEGSLRALPAEFVAPESFAIDMAGRGRVPMALAGCDARIRCGHCDGDPGHCREATTPLGQLNGRITENGQAPASNANGTSKALLGPSRKEDQELLKTLLRSKTYLAYEQAFTGTTGLPVALRPVDCWQLPHHGKENEAPFCALMAKKSRTCQACLSLQMKLAAGAAQGPYSTVCYAGLTETAVPVRLGNRLIGFLQTGQMFTRRPTEREFERIARLLAKWQVVLELAQVRRAFFATRVMDSKQHASVVQLLGFFAQHLAVLSNEILLQSGHPESPMITKAKAIIRDHHTDKLSLPQLARLLHMDPCYFCKRFKEGTGLTFTDYLGRVRVEHAKDLLANSTLRMSEICYQVGFQSLTHFNRKFQKIIGQSPTQYRMRFRKT